MKQSIWACWSAAALLAVPLLAFGESVRVEVIRDNWVSEVGKEGDGNNGGAPRLKVKGIQEFAIVDLDPAALRGRVIRKATLHLHPAGAERLGRVTVSTLTSDWNEGTASGYQVQKGSASFRWARQQEQPWAWPGSDITAVCNGEGNSIWRFADATAPDAAGFQAVAVDPAVVAARVAGLSWGFVVFDDVGSEYERSGDRFTYRHMPNRFLYSRDEGKNRAPYFTVELGDADREPPSAIPAITQTDQHLPAGEALVQWQTPSDPGSAGVAGFQARWSEGDQFDWNSAKPLPQYLVPRPGGAVQMHLRDLGLRGGDTITLGIRAVDGAGNASAVTTAHIRTSSLPATLPLAPAKVQPLAPAPAPLMLGNRLVTVIDALDKVHPQTGALIPAHEEGYLAVNHLFSATGKRIRLFAARNEFSEFQVVLGDAGPATIQATFDDPAITVTPQRFWSVNSKAGPLPDPLMPMDQVQQLEGQKFSSFIVDVYVPHAARPGKHEGKLTIRSGAESITLAIELTVWNFTLPDHLSFLPEMNCYGLPRDDLAWYRLAHAHRANLNRLAYNWRGGVAEDATPKWTGSGFDWTSFDRRYGPILDGSAFQDLPRKGVPVEAFYLPLNENWPASIEQGFKGGYWAESALTDAYRRQFMKACALWVDHLAAKGWKNTLFEFYLNNKVYYKDTSWSRCSAPWIFDEPVNTQDFWALRWYGQAFHEAVQGRAGVQMAYRCDISRPQWRRDILDGLLDVDVVGGDYRRYHRQVMQQKQRNGEMLINYGSSNAIEDSNVQPAAWCLDTWCLGADGVLPWQTVGTDKSWQQADELCLFYPGKPVGLQGPLPSVRLNAYRRGQQDVEYLTILQAMTHSQRFQVASAVRDALGLQAEVVKKNEADAGLVSYRAVDPARLWSLRVRVGQMLDQLAPPAKPQWVDLRPASRDPAKLPTIRAITP